MKLAAFKSQLSNWLTSRFSNSVQSLDPPTLGKSTYIIYPMAGLTSKLVGGIMMLSFEQLVSITFSYSRRLTYAQLPLSTVENSWLIAAMGLVEGAECVIGEGVSVRLNELDPIDIIPYTNNTDWLVTMRFSFAVVMPMILDTGDTNPVYDATLTELLVNGYRAPIATDSELLFSFSQQFDTAPAIL